MNFFQILWILLSIVNCATMMFVVPILQRHYGFVVDKYFVVITTIAVPVLSGFVAYTFSKWRDNQLHHDQ